MCDERMTFEEFLKTDEAKNLYIGTPADADEAVQASLAEYFFEYYICDEPKTFRRYYRRFLSTYYPRYADMIRLCAVSSNMDPFVSYYMEIKDSRVKAGEKSSQKSNTTSTEKTSGGTVNAESTNTRTPELQQTDQVTYAETTEHTGTRTPDLTTTDTQNRSKREQTEETVTHNTTDTETRNLSGSEDISDTRTPNLQTQTQKTGTDTTAETGDITTETDRSETQNVQETNSASATNASNSYNIAYPEANMSTLPADATTPPSINYASSGVYTNGQTTSQGSGTNATTFTGSDDTKETRDTQSETTYDTTDTSRQTGTETTVRDRDTTDTGTVAKAKTGTEGTSGSVTETDQGTVTRAETGTDTTSEEGQKNATTTETHGQTGKETTKDTSERTTTGKETAETTASGTESGTSKETTATGRQEYGRGESTADLLPRVIAAIEICQPFVWLCKKLEVCFDCYYY